MGAEKRKSNPAIDEQYLMSIMADEQKSKSQEKESNENIEVKSASKEKAKQKRNSSQVDYEQLFFRNPQTNARNGKSVYIRPEFHERLSRIVQVIGEDKLSLYAYLDNVLEYHFEEFGEQIVTSFNEKYKPIL
jgi:hypothetical protein